MSVGRFVGSAALSVVVTAASLATAVALLLAIVIRDLPDTSGAVTDFVTEIAVAFDVPEDEADEIAVRVVTAIDDSALGGTMSTAEQVRYAVQVLPAVPIALILMMVTMAGRGRRLCWLGWAGIVTGVALLAFTLILSQAGTASLGPSAEAVARRYVANRVGPGWAIGGVCAVVGLGLFLLGRRPPDRLVLSG